jgi:protoporphyrinogen oxidase
VETSVGSALSFSVSVNCSSSSYSVRYRSGASCAIPDGGEDMPLRASVLFHSCLKAVSRTQVAGKGVSAVLTVTHPPFPTTIVQVLQDETVVGPRNVDQIRPGDRVVVCGAGPAGLTAAYLLAKRGVAVTVLESSDAVGGISQTARYKSYRFDIGGHRFFTKITPVQELWEELLGDEFIDVPRLSRIHYGGKYFNYPLQASNALRGLGVWNAVRIVWSYLDARLHPSLQENTFEEWVCNRFGRRLYEVFFKTYTEKVWGIPCTEIRAEWAAQRIQGLSLARAVLSATALNRRSADIRSLIHTFKYPRLGPGQMWEACRDRIRDMGGEVLMRHYVSGFEMRDGRVSAAIVETGRGTMRFDAEHFISTMPLRSLVRGLGDSVSPEARAGAEGLAYRDFVLVALILEGEDLFPDNWIYIHTPGVKVGRIQNFNNWSRSMVPEPGRTCLGMEYFCFRGDGLWESSDETLIALATQELGELGLARGHAVVDGTVVRTAKAYPIYDSQYRDNVNAVRACIDQIPNLHTIGRNGMHKYNNQDHSMYSAMLTVANMHGAAHDVWSVNTDFEYHEEQRIEYPTPAAGSVPRRVAGSVDVEHSKPDTRDDDQTAVSL